MPKTQKRPLRVAYFTMEIALQKEIPTFAGGLGILAADIMRSATDLSVPACAVTICWRHGALKQTINPDGSQRYEDIPWHPRKLMKRLGKTVTVTMENREVKISGWVYELKAGKHVVPVYFLDTDLEENHPEDRRITEHLYGGEGGVRIKQELVLGIGGVRMLRALGYSDIGTFHMNEGHAAFLTLELLKERDFKNELVRPSCAFTTHTPVPAGHDVFDYDFAWKICGDNLPWHIREIAGKEKLSMTELALNMSHYTCGVSQIHGDVSRRMFGRKDIDSITNGVHHAEWASPEIQKLFDREIEGWRENPSLLTEKCRSLKDSDLWNAHMAAKKRLIKVVNEHLRAVCTEKSCPFSEPFDTDSLTIASARRVVSYKRPELLYTNLERLQEVCGGKIQIIHAGNAHPQDPFGQGVIQRMIERSQKLKDTVRIVYIPNYTIDLAKLLTQGADVWLNTPMRLHEASGTSGMKAALNGTLNLSTLDGWWIEAYAKDPETGWRIGPLANAVDEGEHVKLDAEDLYTQLQYKVIPEFYYEGRARWIRRMKRAIGLGGYFNTHRCVEEYMERAWK